MKIKLLTETAQVPTRQTKGAAGYDLHADIPTPLVLHPGKRALVPTGIALEIPHGFEAQCRSRSGLAIRDGVVVLNAPGTIDSDFRGECKVTLINLSDDAFIIEHGDRIAQLVFGAVWYPQLTPTDELSDTGRGSGGWGSTRKQ